MYIYPQILPGSLGFLTKVTVLNLSSNCLESIPPEISSMTALTSLDLTNNSLTEIPWTLKDLSHLGESSFFLVVDIGKSLSFTEILYLRNNKLTSVPVLTTCVNLKELHLGSNRIQGQSLALLQSRMIQRFSCRQVSVSRMWRTSSMSGCLT